MYYKVENMKRKKMEQNKGINLNYFQIAALATAFRRKDITIKRWAKKNSELLRTETAQELIRLYEDIPLQIPKINF